MNNRYLNLDALRGIAALLVVWQHSSETFVRLPAIAKNGTLLADLADSVDFGRIGVICFFLISGFVIPYSLSGTGATVQKFAIRRLFRLYPAYWTSLLLAVIASAAFSSVHYSTATIAANTTMLQELFGFDNIQGLYWTLTVELIFYGICAAAFCAGMLNRPLPLLLLCWGSLAVFVGWRLLGKIVPAATDFPSPITYTPYCLAVMFCGTLIRYYHSHKTGYWFALLGIAATFAIPLVVLILAALGMEVTNNPVRFGTPHLLALTIFLTALQLPRKLPGFVVFLGTISYSVYLFHPIAMQAIHWSIRQDWGQSFGSFSLGAYILATALLATGFAWLMYKLVEHPAIRLGRHLSRSTHRPVAEPSAPGATG